MSTISTLQRLLGQQPAPVQSAGTVNPAPVSTVKQRQQDFAGRIKKTLQDSGAMDVAANAYNTVIGGGDATTNGTAQAPVLDSYDKMLQYLEANRRVEADADRRAKRREMFAAIGDGISALSSMYQTTKGAPVTYTQGDDMSKVMRDRYDRMIAERKANSDKYLNYLKVQAAKEQNEATKAYRQQQLDETKHYHDAAISRDEDRTEAIRMKNFITAGADAEYNARYNEAIDRGDSEEEAQAYAQRAYDNKVAELFNSWNQQKQQAATDISRQRQTAAKKNEQMGNAAASRAATQKQEADRKAQNQKDKKNKKSGGSSGGSNPNQTKKKKLPGKK